MAKTNVELQALEEAQSRNEQFLDYLCGRATDINALPTPESRIEEFLEFLCHNGGIGGGGGANPFTGLTNATLNGDIITFDKSDGTTVEVPLTDFIRGELTKVGGTAQYEDKIPQLNADGKIHISMIPDLSFNKIHSADNEAMANQLIDNGTAQIGDTIIVKDTGSVYLYVNDQVVNFNDRTIEIAFANGAVKMVNGQIPNPQGDVTVKAEHIEYDDNQIGLNGTTVQDAIKNLNDKFGDYVHKVNDTTNVGGNIHADKIVKLGVDGKLSETMIPNLAITSVNNVASTQEALNKVQDGSVQVGDVVVVAPNNEIYMYNGANAGTFEDNFIQLSLGDGTVKVVNGQRPSSTGSVTVDAEHINYNDAQIGLGGTTVQQAIEKLDGTTITSATYDKDAQVINIAKKDGTNLPPVDLNDLASKTLDNTFIGNNTFKDINLGLPIKINENQNVQGGGWTDAYYEIKTGNRKVTSHAQNSNGYVRNLVVRVGNINLGEKVNVNVWEVKKGQDRSGDTPTQLHSNLELTTVEPTGYFNGGFAVKIPINKKYSDETYFIYQVVGTARIFRVSGATESEDYIFLLPDVDVTRDNIVTSLKDTVGAHILELGDVSVGDLLDSITSEAVTSVNNIKPVDGNVTVNAEHIGYNGNTSNIIATNVQEAIDELKDDMALIDGAEIFIVSDKAELDDFLNNPNTLKHGDLIYIINSTGVVDFNNQPANGGNPVAMIFDDSLNTGNELRVFSKFSSNVNVSANNVSYNDAQTQLNANNVQGAIGKLNEKIANAGTVKSVNGQVPNQQNGSVTIDGTHINATVGTETLNIQEHLGRMNNKVIQAEADAQMARSEVNVLTNHVNTNVINRINGHDTSINSLNSTTNDHSTRIRALERKVPTVRVGDLIQTFADNGNRYSQGGVEYIWLGRTNNVVNRGQYPDLFNAFGLASGTNAFNLPHIADQSVGFDYGKNRHRKTYIVAKIS